MFDKKATKGIEFALFETPSFTQNAPTYIYLGFVFLLMSEGA